MQRYMFIHYVPGTARENMVQTVLMELSKCLLIHLLSDLNNNNKDFCSLNPHMVNYSSTKEARIYDGEKTVSSARGVG